MAYSYFFHDNTGTDPKILREENFGNENSRTKFNLEFSYKIPAMFNCVKCFVLLEGLIRNAKAE